MMLAANIVVGIVGALHVYFLVLEMFFWTKPVSQNIPAEPAESRRLSGSRR
jgi:putative membrane protein